MGNKYIYENSFNTLKLIFVHIKIICALDILYFFFRKNNIDISTMEVYYLPIQLLYTKYIYINLNKLTFFFPQIVLHLGIATI